MRTINTGHEAEMAAHVAYDSSEEARRIQAECRAEREAAAEAHGDEQHESFVEWACAVSPTFDKMWTEGERP